MKHIIPIQLALLFCYSLPSCQQAQKNNPKMEEKTFGWRPSMSAPVEYPIETNYMRFTSADGGSGGMMSLSAEQGWGISNGITSGHPQPVPVKLDISWLSYTENQFWEGHFKLPHDTMLALFEKGWPATIHDTPGLINSPSHTTDTYGEIMVGMAPGGVVVVWLADGGRQVEVGRFQAQKGTNDGKDMIDMTRNGGGNMSLDWLNEPGAKEYYIRHLNGEFYKPVWENLAKNGIPYGLWDRYRQRFNWRPMLEANPVWGGQPYVLREFSGTYYNGEKDVLDSGQLKTNGYRQLPRAKKISIDWTSGNGKRYYSDINFDWEEMYKAYGEIYGKENTEQQAELVIEASRYNDEIHVFLRRKHGEVELKKAVVSTGDDK